MHAHSDVTDSEKLLGFFRNREDCQQAIEWYHDKPGFSEHLNGFIINKLTILDWDGCENIEEVFLLGYSYYELEENGEIDIEENFGVYQHERNALQEKERIILEGLQPYIQHPEGYYVDKHPIKKLHWQEGFETYYY